MERNIINHKWWCSICNVWIGEDVNICPLCKEREDKERMRKDMLLSDHRRIFYIQRILKEKVDYRRRLIFCERFGIDPYKYPHYLTHIARNRNLSTNRIRQIINRVREIIINNGENVNILDKRLSYLKWSPCNPKENL